MCGMTFIGRDKGLGTWIHMNMRERAAILEVTPFGLRFRLLYLYL